MTPLATMRVEGETMLADWPVARTADFSAAYRFDANTLIAIGAGAPPDIVGACLAVWRGIDPVSQAVTMVVQTGDDCVVVSRYGNLVLHGKAKLNLGLAFASLSSEPLQPAIAPVQTAPDFVSAELALFWRIVTIIGRCALPRVIVLDAGGDQITLCAGPAGFALTQGARDLAQLVQTIREASAAGTPVRYTLGAEQAPVAMPFSLCDLLDAINAAGPETREGWRFTAEGWPLDCPSDVTLAVLGHAVTAAQTLVNHLPASGATKVSLFDSNKRSRAIWSVGPDGVRLQGVTTVN